MVHNVVKSKRYGDVIIGSGPAGLQAVIHASRRKLSVLVLGRLRHSSAHKAHIENCLLYTSPSPRDRQKSRMPSSA